MPQDATYSLVVRVRRVTTEDAYVRVLVTEDVLADAPDADGARHLDGDKVFTEARRIAGTDDVPWLVEDRQLDIHPVQNTPPDGR